MTDRPEIPEEVQIRIDTLRGELREEKGVVAALEESKRDAERILSNKIQELSECRAERDQALAKALEAERQRNRLHKALAEGHGVEDGGIWEDRALAAEAKLAEPEASS